MSSLVYVLINTLFVTPMCTFHDIDILYLEIDDDELLFISRFRLRYMDRAQERPGYLEIEPALVCGCLFPTRVLFG